MKAKLLLLSLAVIGAPAWGADLLQVYRDALGYDAQYASAKAALDAGIEKLPQGRAGLLPTFDVTASTVWNDVEFNPQQAGVAGNNAKYNSNGYTVILTQPVFRWQNIAQYGQSKLQVAQAQAQFAGARQEIILRVTQAYFDVLFAQDTLALAQSQKTSISEQLDQARRHLEVGTTTITDVHEAQARFDLAVAQEVAAQNDLEIERHALRQIIGKAAPDPIKTLRTNVELQRPQPDDMARWVDAAERDNPLVAAQQAALEIASKEVGKQRAGHYPTLDLVATHGRSSAGNSVIYGFTVPANDADADTVGLQLNLPLFAGGSVMSKDREAVALREKAMNDLEHVRRSAAHNARQSYLRVTNGLSRVSAFEQALVSSQSALNSNKLSYEAGVGINVDVLNAQRQLYSTRRDLAKARYDTIMAQLRLKAAAGSLAEGDVQAVNALLNDK